ncbi:hypothetical protein G8770_08430 [Aestuariicella hydrocarbonica]|uniref:Uncharacterized protein n=1 Tax=Pseudomaricurvus hydrocarbonicus TaxID=1470433 RepID=A0A9E5JU04_9GAMM|nr:hypothetical protein [Aestuariicella hydrocarbonica]NHO65563.1 hypothetical protein [Aestuariicella hydrocarbonica]
MKDIEIYIREPVLKRVLGWIKGVLGPLEELPVDKSQKGVRMYRAQEQQPPIPIVVQTGIEGGPYVGIWFDSDKTPWESDVECAREAFAAFGLPVQCDPGPEYDNQDDFFRIDEAGEQIVRLKDGLLGVK